MNLKNYIKKLVEDLGLLREIVIRPLEMTCVDPLENTAGYQLVTIEVSNHSFFVAIACFTITDAGSFNVCGY